MFSCIYLFYVLKIQAVALIIHYAMVTSYIRLRLPFNVGMHNYDMITFMHVRLSVNSGQLSIMEAQDGVKFEDGK